MQANLDLLKKFLKPYKKLSWENTEDDIRQTEKKLNILLPAILKDYYRHFGKCPYITQGCNNNYEPLLLEDLFIPNDDFFTVEKNYLVFYQCEESVIYCGIRISDLQFENPPVYLCVWDDKDWQLFNPSLENFLVMTAFKQMVAESRLSYFASTIFGCLEVSEYNTLWQLSDYEVDDLMVNWRDWIIYLKDTVLIGLEVADETEEPLKYVICTAATSNHREALLHLIDSKELLWSCSNTGLEASNEQINEWIRKAQDQSSSMI